MKMGYYQVLETNTFLFINTFSKSLIGSSLRVWDTELSVWWQNVYIVQKQHLDVDMEYFHGLLSIYDLKVVNVLP